MAWKRNQQIQDMLSQIRQHGHMSAAGIKRHMRRKLGELLNIKKKVEKANGLEIDEMFDARMTECGESELQE